MEKVRAHVIVEGRVQGVYFRTHTQEMADLPSLKGWVKNRRDGQVEALFEGEKAKVTNVRVVWEDYAVEFQDFSVTY